MRCAHCDHEMTLVIYTRQNELRNEIVRRRQCMQCLKKFSTREAIKEVRQPGTMKDDKQRKDG